MVKEGKKKRNDLRFRVHREGAEPGDVDNDEEYENVSDLD